MDTTAAHWEWEQKRLLVNSRDSSNNMSMFQLRTSYKHNCRHPIWRIIGSRNNPMPPIGERSTSFSIRSCPIERRSSSRCNHRPPIWWIISSWSNPISINRQRSSSSNICRSLIWLIFDYFPQKWIVIMASLWALKWIRY